jgi:hypothetical protein
MIKQTKSDDLASVIGYVNQIKQIFLQPILFSTFGTTTGFFVAVGLCREAVSAF